MTSASLTSEGTYFCNIKGIKNNLLLFNIGYISGLEYSRKQQTENEKNIFSFEPTVLIFSRSICVKFKENLLAIHVLSLFAACSFLLTVNSPNLFKTYSKLMSILYILNNAYFKTGKFNLSKVSTELNESKNCFN